MFERFTAAARNTVVLAQGEARQLHHGYVGTEHLLLGLLAQPATATCQVLVSLGLDREQATDAVACFVGCADLDADALGSIGIDLGAVRDKVEATFGEGALDRPPGRRRSCHIPFTPRAKKVLELSLREALRLKHKEISDGHILLGLLREGEGLAMKVLCDHGIDAAVLRREVTAALS
jgi:ATP-dependent Clp protease ATP-binding subunit ClpA